MNEDWEKPETPIAENLDHPLNPAYRVHLQRMVLQGLEMLASQGKDEKIKYQALSRLAELTNIDPKVGPVQATQNNIIVDSKNSNGLQNEIAKLLSKPLLTSPCDDPEYLEIQALIGV